MDPFHQRRLEMMLAGPLMGSLFKVSLSASKCGGFNEREVLSTAKLF
jgi:hypothetical protein